MQQSARGIRAAILLSRWLLAPFLIGLFLCLLLLIYRFFADFYGLAINLTTLGWHDLVVGVLNLVDISLTANLVLIVVFSGYGNFISKIDTRDHPGWPEGLASVDFGALKQRVLASIVVIAAVEALAWYFDLEKYNDNAKLAWAVGFPLMFVAAVLMLAISDRLGRE
jgi:uncharacterized protein (TIGR00645 family)